jgi:predicted enzyme related to lactoylglutathione lyase
MNAIDWFEIPTLNFDRAVTFYETALDITMRQEQAGEDRNAVFPYEEGKGISGALTAAKYAQPTSQGVVIYLNTRSAAHLDQTLARVNTAGGSVVMPKTDIGPVGFIAMILDSEGNRIGLHAEHTEA